MAKEKFIRHSYDGHHPGKAAHDRRKAEADQSMRDYEQRATRPIRRRNIERARRHTK
jgi:hypothetical protein|tara:strand:- start:1570 stop:1740 length:171 start_codon:yes stop_codon:yes gene_type:complete